MLTNEVQVLLMIVPMVAHGHVHGGNDVGSAPVYVQRGVAGLSVLISNRMLLQALLETMTSISI
jgi:hypothetical protein